MSHDSIFSLMPEQVDTVATLRNMFRNVQKVDLVNATPNGLIVIIHIGGSIPQIIKYTVNSDGESRWLSEERI